MNPQSPQSLQSLPTLCLYRHNCHSHTQSHLAYLCSTTQIKQIQFSTPSSPSTPPKIKQTKSISIPLEPVKGICVNIWDGKVYVGVAMITRVIVFCEGEKIFQSVLELGCNVVGFEDGFVGVVGVDRGFVFMNRKGNVTTFYMDTKTKSVYPYPQPTTHKISSFLSNPPNFHTGTQSGQILHIVLQQTPILAQKNTYQTKSQFPILTMSYIPNHDELVVGTCQGEIHLLNQDLTLVSSVAVHYGAIMRMMVCGDYLYTVGEEQRVNKYLVCGGRKVRLVESRQMDKLVSLLYAINNQAYVSFYQTPVIMPI